MTYLLPIALVLLVAVVGLALLQRRSARDMTKRTLPPVSAASPPPPVDRDPASGPLRISDPVFGNLTFDGSEGWTSDESLDLGGEDISVYVSAGPAGPQDVHRAWMQAVLTRYDTIETEARALLVSVLEPLHVAKDDLAPWEIVIGPIDDQAVFEGRLEYHVMHDDVDDVYVRSIAMWDHLEPHLTRPGDGDEAGIAGRTDPVLGAITYSGEDSWSNVVPLPFGGRGISVVLLAGTEGPDERHQTWIRELVSREEHLLGQATDLARTRVPSGVALADLVMTIAVIGVDEDGRSIGGLCFDYPGKGTARCDVWSRDRWATLSFDRG